MTQRAVSRAVCRKAFQIEDLAQQQAHINQGDDVEWLEHLGRLVRPHLRAPGVGGDAGEVEPLDPFRCVDCEARRVAARRRGAIPA